MKRAKIAAVIVVLLGVLAAVNYAFKMDPVQLAARGVGRDAHDHGGEDEATHEAESAVFEPVGPEDAEVVIEVFYRESVGSGEMMWTAVTGAASPYEPHVRVEACRLEDEENARRARELPLQGGQGLAVNGKAIVEVPGLGSFGMVALLGGPQDRNWNEPVLRRVIEHELTSKGVSFTAAPAGEGPTAHGHEHGHDHAH